jgi:TRAP-type C4-dicarboxylate transport system permease small subunit
MSAMVVNVLFQVVSRFVLGQPSSFTEELARFLLIWIGLFGGCLALRRGLHTSIELIPQAVGESSRRRLALFSRLAVATFAVVILILGGGHLVQLSLALGQTSAALGIGLGWVYLALPLSGLLMLFYAMVGPENASAGTEEPS